MKTARMLVLLLLVAFFGWSCAAISPAVYEQEEVMITEETVSPAGEFEEIAEEEEEEGWSRLEEWEALKEMSEREYEE